MLSTKCDFDTDVHSVLNFMSDNGTKENKMMCDPCNRDNVYHLIHPRDSCRRSSSKVIYDPMLTHAHDVLNEVEDVITMETADAFDFYSMELQFSPVVKPNLNSCSIEHFQSLLCSASPEPKLVTSVSHKENFTTPIAPEFSRSDYIPLQTMWTPQCHDTSMSIRDCQHNSHQLGIQVENKFLQFEPNYSPSLVSMLGEHREMFQYTNSTPVIPLMDFPTLSPAKNTAITEREKVCCIASSSYDILKKKKLTKNTQATVKQRKQRKMKHRQSSSRFNKTRMSQKRSNGGKHEAASSIVKMISTVGVSGITSNNELGSFNNISTGSFFKSLENTSCKESRRGSRKEPAPHTGMKLWQFLLKVLVEEQNATVVHWISKENGTFCVSDPERLAKLWGKHKNRPEMNYDKLSRAVRYYYHKNLLDKVPKRLCYQFRYYSRWWEHLEMADSQFKISAIPLPPVGPSPLIHSLE